MRLALTLLVPVVLVGCSNSNSRRAGASNPRDAQPPAAALMVAPATVQRACEEIRRSSARQTRRRVVCPPLIPKSRRATITYAGGVLSGRDFGPGYLFDGRDARGSSVYAGHWTFAGGQPAAVHTPLASGPGHLVGVSRTKARLAGQPVVIYRVTNGMTQLSGHVVVEWTWRGQAYQVSVHRWRSDRQGFAQATRMARAVIQVLRRK
jgi:hypothetical protein